MIKLLSRHWGPHLLKENPQPSGPTNALRALLDSLAPGCPPSQCPCKLEPQSYQPVRIRKEHLASIPSSSDPMFNSFAGVSPSYLLQSDSGPNGLAVPTILRRGPSHHHHCSIKMGLIMFWPQCRSLFCFNSHNSAKQPSPRELAGVCFATEVQIYSSWNPRTREAESTLTQPLDWQ